MFQAFDDSEIFELFPDHAVAEINAFRETGHGLIDSPLISLLNFIYIYMDVCHTCVSM